MSQFNMLNCTENDLNDFLCEMHDSQNGDTTEIPTGSDRNESRLVQHIAWLIFGLLICTCNVLTIGILTRLPRLSVNHTTMHLLLGNLALADSLVGVILLLLTGIEMQNSAYRHSCLAIYGLFMLSAGESTTTLTLLAYDRYKAIVHPLGHRLKKGDNERTVCNLAITWAFWCIVGLVPVLPAIALADNPLSEECRLVTDISKWHVLTDMVILHVISYTAIIYYHIQVVRTIRSKNRIFPQIASSATTPYTASRMRQHVTLTRKVVIITGLFCVCWIPFQVMITVFTACPHDFLSNDDVHCGISGNHFTIPATMATLNSLVNSFVYIFAFKKFREALRQMFCCRGNEIQKQNVVSDSSVPTVDQQNASGSDDAKRKLNDFSQLNPLSAMKLARNEK